MWNSMVTLMYDEIITVIVKGGFIMIPLLGASLISVAVIRRAFCLLATGFGSTRSTVRSCRWSPRATSNRLWRWQVHRGTRLLGCCMQG